MARSVGHGWIRAGLWLWLTMLFSLACVAVTEIAYDDGTMEASRLALGAGRGFAVRFTPPPGSGALVAARLYIGGFQGGPGPIEVHVWDGSRNAVGTPIQVTPRQEGWYDVDLTGLGFAPTTDFYIGYTLVMDVTAPRIGVDNSGAGSGRSYNVPAWQAVASPSDGFMIRAVVRRSGGGDRELAYDDGTHEDARGWAQAGNGFAVRFSPPARGETLLRARFFFSGFSSQGPGPIEVHVWDDGFRGLIAPIRVTPTQSGWFEVDLAGYGLSPLSYFFVGYIQLSGDAHPWLGLDTSGAGAGRSYNVPAWTLMLPAHANGMIRVVVGTAGAANRPPTVTLAYSPPHPTTADTVSFVANAVDPDGDPLTLEWYLNGVRQQTVRDHLLLALSAGTHTVRVVVSDGRGGVAEASVTVTVRSAGPGVGDSHTYGSIPGWYFVSVPTTGDVPAIFGGMTLWNWNGMQYEAAGTLSPNMGYWARLSGSQRVAVGGTVPTTDQALALGRTGWHMVSSPWNYPKSAILVRRAGDTRNWADAVAAGWVRDTVWAWPGPGGVYGSATALQAWYGYWLRANETGLTLEFRYASRAAAMRVGCFDLKPMDLVPGDMPPPPPVGATGVGSVQFGNSPNPIRDVNTTVFRVLGPMAALVTDIMVLVFDLSGKLVWQGSAAGAELTWHTDDLAGRYLANGVYVYQITAQVAGTTVSSGFLKLSILR